MELTVLNVKVSNIKIRLEILHAVRALDNIRQVVWQIYLTAQ